MATNQFDPIYTTVRNVDDAYVAAQDVVDWLNEVLAAGLTHEAEHAARSAQRSATALRAWVRRQAQAKAEQKAAI